MLVGGDIIEVKNKNYLFCGLKRGQTEFNIRMIANNDYFSLSSYIDEIKEDAMNDALYQTAVFYTVNDNLELDDNSIRTHLYFNMFDDSTRVKHIDNIVDYLMVWRTKVCMLNNGNKSEIIQLMDTDEAVSLLETERTKHKKENLFVFKNFLTDLLAMYKNTEYYEQIKDYCMNYHVKERRRCILDLNVFRDGDRFLFLHKGAILSLYASVDIKDVKGCALALAKRGKVSHEVNKLEKVLGD